MHEMRMYNLRNPMGVYPQVTLSTLVWYDVESQNFSKYHLPMMFNGETFEILVSRF